MITQAAFHVGPGWAPVGQSWAPNGPRMGPTGAHLGMLLGKGHMPRLCQNMKLGEVLNPYINAKDERVVRVKQTAGKIEYIAVSKFT